MATEPPTNIASSAAEMVKLPTVSPIPPIIPADEAPPVNGNAINPAVTSPIPAMRAPFFRFFFALILSAISPFKRIFVSPAFIASSNSFVVVTVIIKQHSLCFAYSRCFSASPITLATNKKSVSHHLSSRSAGSGKP